MQHYHFTRRKNFQIYLLYYILFIKKWSNYPGSHFHYSLGPNISSFIISKKCFLEWGFVIFFSHWCIYGCLTKLLSHVNSWIECLSAVFWELMCKFCKGIAAFLREPIYSILVISWCISWIMLVLSNIL